MLELNFICLIAVETFRMKFTFSRFNVHSSEEIFKNEVGSRNRSFVWSRYVFLFRILNISIEIRLYYAISPLSSTQFVIISNSLLKLFTTSDCTCNLCWTSDFHCSFSGNYILCRFSNNKIEFKLMQIFYFQFICMLRKYSWS